jgi:Cdc6-like AAA superfamily ATPase
MVTARLRKRATKLHRPVPKALLAAVERDRWIGYPAGDAGLLRLGELFAMRPRVRMPCLLIYGVSGAGKSMLLEKFKRDHAPKRSNRSGQRPIIATQMPPVPVIRSLYGEMVRTLGGNVRPTARYYELEHTAISLLSHANPRMLIIDEIQHLLSCSAREQRAALNMVKFLSNERRMTIVAAGTHEALHVMRFDPQIASRFEQMELPVWSESDELRRFIAGYLAMLPVQKNPAAIDQRFVEYLLALTDGVTGRIIDLLRRAAVNAMTHKARSVGLDQLLAAGAHLPAIINQRADFTIYDTIKS